METQESSSYSKVGLINVANNEVDTKDPFTSAINIQGVTRQTCCYFSSTYKGWHFVGVQLLHVPNKHPQDEICLEPKVFNKASSQLQTINSNFMVTRHIVPPKEGKVKKFLTPIPYYNNVLAQAHMHYT